MESRQNHMLPKNLSEFGPLLSAWACGNLSKNGHCAILVHPPAATRQGNQVSQACRSIRSHAWRRAESSAEAPPSQSRLIYAFPALGGAAAAAALLFIVLLAAKSNDAPGYTPSTAKPAPTYVRKSSEAASIPIGAIPFVGVSFGLSGSHRPHTPSSKSRGDPCHRSCARWTMIGWIVA
jgi:hypothetical protein